MLSQLIHLHVCERTAWQSSLLLLRSGLALLLGARFLETTVVRFMRFGVLVSVYPDFARFHVFNIGSLLICQF